MPYCARILQKEVRMGYHFIKSKLTGMDRDKMLKQPLVIDITGASESSKVALQTYPQNSTDASNADTFNQQWEFPPDPSGSGYHFIKSKLDGSYITFAPSQQGTLEAFALSAPQGPQSLWRFVQDPAGSGYCFIQSQLDNDFVIDVQGASPQEKTALVGFPLKSTANDNQLWRATFPSTVALPSTLTFEAGTGPDTTFSGSGECMYAISLTIQQDGTWCFSGTYTNRGDTDLSTAPSQYYATGFIVHDLAANGYGFIYSGYVYSAPTDGCNATWNNTGKSQLIADNWASIACRAQASNTVYNSTAGDINGAMQSAISNVSPQTPTPTIIFSGSNWFPAPPSGTGNVQSGNPGHEASGSSSPTPPP
jgi:hypothetical protein